MVRKIPIGYVECWIGVFRSWELGVRSWISSGSIVDENNVPAILTADPSPESPGDFITNWLFPLLVL